MLPVCLVICASSTVCALIFAGFIFRRFAIFVVFAFLNSQLLGTMVLKYSQVKYLWIRIRSESVYHNTVAAEVQNLLDPLLDLFEDVIVLGDLGFSIRCIIRTITLCTI